MRTTLRRLPALIGAATVTGAAWIAGSAATVASAADVPSAAFAVDPEHLETATPIKHVVVIFDENVSFDHYFGTYPHAANPPGEPPFYPAPFTPKVNNLVTANVLTDNPNLNPANGSAASNPFRLDRTQASTTDQDHNYTPEQQAYDAGKADLFPLNTGTSGSSGSGAFYTAAVVMGYFDGNTVTGLWNYAQHFAMSDNGHGAAYGPSTPGAIEVASGQTNGYQTVGPTPKTSAFIPDGAGGYTDMGDVDPAYDVCSSTTENGQMLGNNIGDLLNAHHISWGGFMGGFNLSLTNANGTTGCARSTTSAVTDTEETDYIPHHMWFQYYASTRNATHARPNSVWAIGHTYDQNGQQDPANHEYDVNDFYAAVQAGNFPAVAYLKAPGYQDGHPGYSDPLDEQAWIVQVVNFIEQRPEWKDTAIIIDWDDSDGWYDHAFTTPTSPSFNATADQLDGPGVCGSGPPLDGIDGSPVNGRCGPGPRLPFFVISPYAKPNYVSHTLITQASVVRFIEDNWLHGERLGGGSFDATAGSIMDMFDFGPHFPNPPLFLSEDDGTPVDRPTASAP
ncbi:MAG TPA: alkaline phosphatase family protein [Steroidobacteraceae bacterium]|nr:alkaline phosphatase family protein [Steroidobacteraceae bacterium]